MVSVATIHSCQFGFLLQQSCHILTRRTSGRSGGRAAGQDSFVEPSLFQNLFVELWPALKSAFVEKPAQNSVSHAIPWMLPEYAIRGLHFALQIAGRCVMNELIGRIRSEFLEMPGLRLTVVQASRLWGLEQDDCRRVIDVLVGSAFLRWTPAGTVIRAAE